MGSWLPDVGQWARSVGSGQWVKDAMNSVELQAATCHPTDSSHSDCSS